MRKRSFLLKRLLFARKCERTFEGVPIYMGEEVEGTLRLFSAFSPADPKGCSKDDERVLKGCLCLCHPSHNLFFRRKLLHGTILFPKFSAKVILFFDICKFCTPVLPIFYIFYLFFRTLRPLARNCIPVIFNSPLHKKTSGHSLSTRLLLSSFPITINHHFTSCPCKV